MRRSRIGYANGAIITVAACAATLAGCNGGDPPSPVPTATTTSRPADRDALAILAATAKDKRYVATYRFSVPQRADRTITVAIATDGSWIVGVPGGAVGGLADIAIFRSPAGLFQCALGPAVGAGTARPDLPPVEPGCARVNRLTASTDPRVQHLFTDWIDPLINRAAALSIAAAPLLAGARGQCFSVEPNSAALASPVDPGIYCYDTDGVLTAAKVTFGTLIIVGSAAPAPPSVAQPAPTVTRPPLKLAAPPPPPSPEASVTPGS